MAEPRKICVVTGSRAEYGLLYWLMKEIAGDPELALQLIATGMHLSPEFGLTWRQIEADGFTINRKVEMLLSSDTPVGISKAMGLGLIGFADALAELQPDIVVVLGDRFEIFAAAQAAMNLRIPLAHIHGGELSEGAVDDAIRHALTKLSHLHFTAAEVYRQRVIQLGEQPERVFNVGAPGLDQIVRLPLLPRTELEAAIGFKLAERNLLVTFHPATLEHASAAEQFDQLLLALDEYPEVNIIFTYSNADADGRVIAESIEGYRQRWPERVAAFVSLGSLRYLSAMRHVDAVVGNSSSGLLEAPAFKIPTVNIGDRQRGRLCAASVLHCPPRADAIKTALEQVWSGELAPVLANLQHPYGSGGASAAIKQVLQSTDLNGLLKKRFYDLERPA
ncbi:UDP-N-acetylglucosamine 2-epimerase [Methylomonas koyamae]|uniref:UDP-N-acetyl glucosamine 2-epimerase n=1 Tax=Methylomonas koyamae TaxID=702114 RepID=A0A291INC6_9GAMM|nr:UDP-N-acetylglucosamine 2-epimerase [Methylomonas koyamae]ATG91744.1 UDP-N-acetylglucosamine 2-epimerase [Methylomonas koyamae]OAI27711.1 UDP-N-acetyl glucosamine 2-epimerase [Methylomonas koyamae]